MKDTLRIELSSDVKVLKIIGVDVVNDNIKIDLVCISIQTMREDNDTDCSAISI